MKRSRSCGFERWRVSKTLFFHEPLSGRKRGIAMDRRGLLGIASDLIGIIGFTVAGIAIVNNWIDTLRLPTTFSFYFLAFYAFVAAIVGGLFWNLYNREDPTIGGKKEPQG